MQPGKLVYLIVALLAAALLWGCGSSGSGGSAVTPRTGPDVLEDETSCFGCHAEGAMYYAHNPDNPIWIGTDAENLVGTVDNLYEMFEGHSCQDCHGGGAAHSGTRGSLPHPRPTIAVCAECHVNEAVASEYHTFVNRFGDNILACTTCHDPLLSETILEFVADGTRKELSCLDCHNDALTDEELAQSPIGSEIYDRFNNSRHANQRARAAYCSACHSHEGGVTLLSMPRMTADADLAAAYTDALDVYLLPEASATREGVTKKNCATCHDPHDAGLRGDGTILATSANVVGFPAQVEPEAIDGEIRVVYSAEFSLCAACHMVDLTATWDADAGYNGRGMIRYELSDAYTATMLDANGVTYDRSGVFYHDGASGNGRTMIDTHFAGTVHSTYVNFDASIDPVEVVGYNINPGDPNACTICHDPHAASKMLALEAPSSTFEYADVIDNNAVSYAQAMGMTHSNYINDAFSRNRQGCTPCHTGRDFAKLTFGAEIADLGSPRWNTLGCVSCHDLTPANTTASTNAPNLANVRSFPDGNTFEFNSGAAMPSEFLDISYIDRFGDTVTHDNNVCFECHKGRTPYDNDPEVASVYGINYLHYSPSFATMMGTASEMIPTYADRDYAEGNTLPLAYSAHENYNNCLGCHDIHTPYSREGFEPANLQTNLCGSCHYVTDFSLDNYWRSFNVLRKRTEVFANVLKSTITDELAAQVGSNNDAAIIIQGVNGANVTLSANDRASYTEIFGGESYATATTDEAIAKRLKTYITGSTRDITGSRLVNNDLATAGAIWKNFMYDDKGGWAHNSILARQLMYDATLAIGGEEAIAKFCDYIADPAADIIGVQVTSPHPNGYGSLVRNLDAGATSRPIVCP